MIVSSVVNSSDGFCAGSRTVTDHQRINCISFDFSAAVSALLAISGLRTCARSAPCSTVSRPSRSLARRLADHPHGPHPAASCHAVRIRFAKPVVTATPAPHDALSFNTAGEERPL